jgi:hypothetical protein
MDFFSFNGALVKKAVQSIPSLGKSATPPNGEGIGEAGSPVLERPKHVGVHIGDHNIKCMIVSHSGGRDKMKASRRLKFYKIPRMDGGTPDREHRTAIRERSIWRILGKREKRVFRVRRFLQNNLHFGLFGRIWIRDNRGRGGRPRTTVFPLSRRRFRLLLRRLRRTKPS